MRANEQNLSSINLGEYHSDKSTKILSLSSQSDTCKWI